MTDYCTTDGFRNDYPHAALYALMAGAEPERALRRSEVRQDPVHVRSKAIVARP